MNEFRQCDAAELTQRSMETQMIDTIDRHICLIKENLAEDDSQIIQNRSMPSTTNDERPIASSIDADVIPEWFAESKPTPRFTDVIQG